MPLFVQIIATVALALVMVFTTLVMAAGIFDPDDKDAQSPTLRWASVGVLVAIDVALAIGVAAIWV